MTELGDCFLSFAQSVGNYRMENRASLSRSQYRQIKDLHLALLHYADDLYTTSATLVMNEVKTSLDQIKKITSQINRTYTKLQKIQKAIDVAAAGVALAASVFSKNPLAIIDAINGLANEWKSK